MRSIRSRCVSALVALIAMAGIAVFTAPVGAANAATPAEKTSALKKERTKRLKKCQAPLTKANQRSRKANKQVTKAKKQVRKTSKRARSTKTARSAKLATKARKKLKSAKKKATKAKKQLRKAKGSKKSCVKRVDGWYKRELEKILPLAPYKARGSVGDAYVTDAVPGTELLLVDKSGKTLRTGVADDFGAKVFYDVEPGPDYTVRTTVPGQKSLSTEEFPVLAPDDNPKQSFYDAIELQQGLNYVTMRDGIELAMTVRLPSGKTLADGPFPTIIEHSGYQTAAPHDLLVSILGGGNDPLAPVTSTAVGALIGPQAGFASVSVQMRGSGCSGGAFDLFGLPTTYDGYDMVEAVAAQDWVKGNKVGMAGISYSGISQLFAAGTQPPHLAAISPMSVTDDVYQGTGFPGGIFNNGFAYSWITDRANDARPAPEFGQPWAKAMSTNGDPNVGDPNLREEQKQHCIDNQKLRLQTRDYNHEIETNPYRTPLLFDSRAPGAWLKKVNVPVFFMGQFQDEQTGAHFPEALAGLRGKPNVWITLQNGVHVDALGPSAITQWLEFMKLFVADEIPKMPPLLVNLSGTLYDQLADAGALPVQESELADSPSVAAAMAEFRQTNPRVRILMDNGAAIPGEPGAIGAAWEKGFDNWPIDSLTPTNYFLGPNGELNKTGTASGQSSYVSDPNARPARTLGANAQGDSWLAQPPYNWQPLATGKGLGWTSAALDQDVFIAGPSSLDLYLKSNKADTDLQVTLTEVRPDGKETYVQSGWLRASHRAIDPALSTANNPVQTHLEKDAANLTAGQFNLTRVQVFPVVHLFRAGSKIRVNLQAPGGDRTIWDFDTIETGDTENTIGFGDVTPSKLVLPVIPGENAEGHPLPGPTDLRGQPSRTYTPASNGG